MCFNAKDVFQRQELTTARYRNDITATAVSMIVSFKMDSERMKPLRTWTGNAPASQPRGISVRHGRFFRGHGRRWRGLLRYGRGRVRRGRVYGHF